MICLVARLVEVRCAARNGRCRKVLGAAFEAAERTSSGRRVVFVEPDDFVTEVPADYGGTLPITPCPCYAQRWWLGRGREITSRGEDLPAHALREPIAAARRRGKIESLPWVPW